MIAPCTYNNDKAEKYSDTNLPLFYEAENTILYLIELGDQYGVNMNKVLNSIAKNGTTLFMKATVYFESFALDLMRRNAMVNTISRLFLTPSFQVCTVLKFKFINFF